MQGGGSSSFLTREPEKFKKPNSPVQREHIVEYIKKWFSKQVICILKLPTLESYTDGAIMYHVENVKADFPLPEGCLGRELYIAVPGRDTLSVRIREEYRNYYKKA